MLSKDQIAEMVERIDKNSDSTLVVTVHDLGGNRKWVELRIYKPKINEDGVPYMTLKMGALARVIKYLKEAEKELKRRREEEGV